MQQINLSWELAARLLVLTDRVQPFQDFTCPAKAWNSLMVPPHGVLFHSIEAPSKQWTS